MNEIFFCICFIFPFGFTVRETFPIKASITGTQIVPLFSEESTFEDFKNTLHFVLQQPNIPTKLNFYFELEYQPYSIEELYFNETLLQSLYEDSKVTTSQYAYLRFAQLLIYGTNTFCEVGFCLLMRINFIVITDYHDFTHFYEISQIFFHQMFYFIVISDNQPCIRNNLSILDYPILCFNALNDDDTTNTNTSAEIFQDTLSYTLDPPENTFNFFIVINESHLFEAALLLQALQMNGDNHGSGWGLLSPTFYAVAIRRNETFSYQSVALNFPIGNLNGIGPTLMSNIRSTSTTLSTSMVEKYINEIYNRSSKDTNILSFTNHQWNVLITDEYPLWLKNANVTFNSFKQHLDIYLYGHNNSETINKLYTDLEKHQNDILVNDENSTERGNHILMIKDISEFVINYNFWPTNKRITPAKFFDYVSPDRSWIWISASIVVAVLAIVALVAFLIWRRRMNKKLEEKYSWALKAGFTQKEADVIIEKGKELFIDENFIQVDFKNIKGKGSSAIVYGGLLNGTSAVALLRPCLETKNYANCNIAIKIVNKYGKDDYEQIFREVEAAMKLGWHRHICCLLGWSIHQSTPALIYESIDGGDLYSWIKEFTNLSEQIPEKNIAQILWQISDGMEYICSHGIVHKDLAARNILLTSGFVAKITDFGLASSCDESFTYQAPVQRRLPIRWMAPEALTDRLFSEASDSWSFGVLAWELFNNGSIPYGNIDGNDILEYLHSGKRLELPNEISEEWKKLLNNCWKTDKDERPSFKSIKFQLSIFLENFTQNYGYLSVNE